MRFLVDECLRARVAELLSDAGHDAVHVGVVGLLGRPDTEIMEFALRDDRVVISADTDFGELLARSQASLPSVICFAGTTTQTVRRLRSLQRCPTSAKVSRSARSL